MKLKGKNLGERQHDFNTKVNEAVTKKINFAAIKDDPVDTDIDQLFKIDIASRLKDVAFLLQTLVSGDSLYITRALKSVWLFGDEYQHVMNPEYFIKNIFPHMSSKMMKKLLTTASMWVRNEKRAEQFYSYCKENDMDNIAVKFLVLTSETFKESVLQNDFEMVNKIDEEIIQFLIGSSFQLAEVYRNKSSDPTNAYRYKKSFKRLRKATPKVRRMYGNYVPECKSNRVLYQLRFLYFLDSDKYLDMLETHYAPVKYDSSIRFGIRISKDIIKRYKKRMLKHPQIYTTILNKNTIAKYINSEDSKLILRVLLSASNRYEFLDQCMTELEFIVNIIPLDERYEFINKIYAENFESAFEINQKFYDQEYYKYMTEEQQEKLALDQLASKKELLGAGQDFLWYKLVRFDLAFEEVKKLILITKNGDKRIDILSVLVKCSKNQIELKKLLDYFYTRHINETIRIKVRFLDCVNSNHNIFSFYEDCWNSFNKILYSLDVYNAKNMYCLLQYKMITLFYHLLHRIDLPEDLKCFALTSVVSKKFNKRPNGKLAYIPYGFESKIKEYDQNGVEVIYKNIINIYVEELIHFENEEYDDNLKIKAREVIKFIERLRSTLKKKDDLPEVVTKFKNLDAETFKESKELKKVTTQDLMRMLKKDASLVTDFDLLENSIQNTFKFNFKEPLQKLNIYFHDDTAQQLLEYFKKACSKEMYRVVYASVNAILLLADQTFKFEFILQHAPERSKVQHDEIDRNLLYIREAICRYACYSRPPIEIEYVVPYITGDYLQYCLPKFNVYMTRYPPAIREKFVCSLLNTPVSIQKHGIRLAFQCFKLEELIELVLSSWKKYQNVSLRMAIYEHVYRSVTKCEATRKEMFKILIKITLDLKEDECDDVYKIVQKFRNFPHELQGFYMDALWTAISKFSACTITTKAYIIHVMAEHVKDVPKKTVKTIIKHYIDGRMAWDRDDEESVLALTQAFISEYCWDEDIAELVKYIIQNCVGLWIGKENSDCIKYNKISACERFCTNFINSLFEYGFCHMPHELKGFYLDALWTTASEFSEMIENLETKANIINHMIKHINDIPKTVNKIVTSHIELVKNKRIPVEDRSDYKDYDKAAWALTYAYICEHCKDVYILELIKLIIHMCVEKWNEVHFDYESRREVYVFQRFCSDFIKNLIEETYHFSKSSSEINCMLESVLTYLNDYIPKHKMFVLLLHLKVAILTNSFLEYVCVEYKNCKLDDEKAEDIAKKYAMKLENLVRETIQDTKLFHVSFLNIFERVIVTNVRSMAIHLPRWQYLSSDLCEWRNKLLILIALNFADSSMSEILLLAVAMKFDISPDKEWNNYRILLDKIAKIDNDNVKYFNNVKVVKNGYTAKGVYLST